MLVAQTLLFRAWRRSNERPRIRGRHYRMETHTPCWSGSSFRRRLVSSCISPPGSTTCGLQQSPCQFPTRNRLKPPLPGQARRPKLQQNLKLMCASLFAKCCDPGVSAVVFLHWTQRRALKISWEKEQELVTHKDLQLRLVSLAKRYVLSTPEGLKRCFEGFVSSRNKPLNQNLWVSLVLSLQRALLTSLTWCSLNLF